MRPPLASRLTRFARRFARDEGGVVTVEAVLWIPFFFMVLTLITDVSMIFFSRAQAFRVIEAANRSFALGKLADDAATEAWVRTSFTMSGNENVDTRTSSTRGIVVTRMDYPARDVVMFNSLGVLSGWRITVQTQLYVERAI